MRSASSNPATDSKDLPRLRSTVQAILSGNARYAELRSFIATCHSIALHALRLRAHRGRLNIATLGLPLEDLATDCIATLFERSADGRFLHFEDYFGAMAWATLSPAELRAALHRLLYSRVRQEVSRLWKQADPSLERLLRNLRGAARTSPSLIETRLGREAWITVRNAQPAALRRPVMPAPELEARLTPHLRARMRIPAVTALVARVLSGDHEWRPAYPLVRLAVIIRAASVRPAFPADAVGAPADPVLSAAELRDILGTSVAGAEFRLSPSYLASGKIDIGSFAGYFLAVYDILEEEFLTPGNAPLSFYRHLALYDPRLTPETYRLRHRCHLEYCVRTTRRVFLSNVRSQC